MRLSPVDALRLLGGRHPWLVGMDEELYHRCHQHGVRVIVHSDGLAVYVEFHPKDDATEPLR